MIRVQTLRRWPRVREKSRKDCPYSFGTKKVRHSRKLVLSSAEFFSIAQTGANRGASVIELLVTQL